MISVTIDEIRKKHNNIASEESIRHELIFSHSNKLTSIIIKTVQDYVNNLPDVIREEFISVPVMLNGIVNAHAICLAECAKPERFNEVCDDALDVLKTALIYYNPNQQKDTANDK